MANIIKELKKKRKKPSKLKKAKLLYMVKDQISHKNEISTQSTTTKKSKKKIESNEDDGYTTYEEECNGVVTSKQIYDESQKIEEIKDEEMAHQFTAIDPSKLPQIQYNQIKIRK